MNCTFCIAMPWRRASVSAVLTVKLIFFICVKASPHSIGVTACRKHFENNKLATFLNRSDVFWPSWKFLRSGLNSFNVYNCRNRPSTSGRPNLSEHAYTAQDHCQKNTKIRPRLFICVSTTSLHQVKSFAKSKIDFVVEIGLLVDSLMGCQGAIFPW